MCYCHVCIPSFKPCVIAMFVCLRSSCVLLPCLYTFVQAVCYCHVCIPSFKLCVIAMFVYLRSSRVLLPCLYTFVQACVIAMFVYLRPDSSIITISCYIVITMYIQLSEKYDTSLIIHLSMFYFVY